MFPVTLVDNFFEAPHLIRNYGLSLPFHKPDTGECPGLRTKHLHKIDREFHSFVGEKILSLFFDLKKDDIEADLELHFQQSFEKYEEGWVHLDSRNYNFAGVVYLTPNAPLNGGTSIYRPDDLSNLDPHQRIKYEFYSDRETNVELVRSEREKHNSCFTQTVEVNNIFNRCLFYDSTYWHKENKLFGTTKEDCRLTLVFFGRMRTGLDTHFPIIRSRLKPTF